MLRRTRRDDLTPHGFRATLMTSAASVGQNKNGATMASAAFERFQFSFFEDPDSARRGLASPALAELTGEERVRAEDMLINNLPDSSAVIGLGVLRSSRAAPQLVELFEVEQRAAKLRPDDFRPPDGFISLAKTLWQIRPDPRWLEAMIDVLTSSSHSTQRQTAAELLYDVYDPAAVQALITALNDPASLVRHHACRALLMIHGLPADPKDLQHMMYRVMSDDPHATRGRQATSSRPSPGGRSLRE
jgi:HEAT repeat protein